MKHNLTAILPKMWGMRSEDIALKNQRMFTVNSIPTPRWGNLY